MKKLFALGAAGALAFGLAISSPAPADAAGYLKIGDIKGESTDDKHKDWINLLSYSWGEPAAGRDAASGLPTGKRQHKPLTITKHVDKASPMLQQAATSGKVIKEMEIVLPNDDPAQAKRMPYLKYELKDVIVTSYQSSGTAAGDTVPMETISLNYGKISYRPAREAPKPAMVQKNQSDMEFVRERATREKDRD